MIDRVERLLGRTLDRASLGSLATLNEVTPAMMQDLTRLVRSGEEASARSYLMLCLRDGEHHRHAWDFVQEVVVGGADPETWGYRDLLVVLSESTRGMVLTLSGSWLRAALSPIAGARWHAVSAGDAVEVNRRASESEWGSPGVLVKRVPYWRSVSGEGQHSLVVDDPAPPSSGSELRVVADEKLDLAVRRWIARRVSWWSSKAGLDLRAADLAQLARTLDVDPELVTPDAAIAVAALRRELERPFDPSVHVYGFIGPDEWYAGPADAAVGRR